MNPIAAANQIHDIALCIGVITLVAILTYWDSLSGDQE